MDNESTPTPPPPPQYDSTSPITRCLGFLSETRSRLVQSFARPLTTFPHTPLNSQGIHSLNYPFQSISPSSSSPQSFSSRDNDDCLSEDCGVVTITATFVESHPLTTGGNNNNNIVERLEEKVSNLEFTVRTIMESEDDKSTNNNGPVNPVTFEELDKLLPQPPPESPEFGNNLHPHIYQDIIALYEESLHASGVGSRDISTITEADLKEPSSNNKERNVRCEVLKWNRD